MSSPCVYPHSIHSKYPLVGDLCVCVTRGGSGRFWSAKPELSEETDPL